MARAVYHLREASNKMKYIETPAPKTKKKASKKMSEKKAFELPAEKGPKTINIRVKTLAIVITLLLSHGLAFYAGTRALDAYNGWLDRLAAERTAKAGEVPATAVPAGEQLKANQ